MTRMRTLDRKYLSENPAGDETAEFTVSVTVPTSIEVPDNADGSRPSITLKASSDTYAHLLGILSYVHDEDLAENIMMFVLENADQDKIESFSSLEEAAPYIREAAAEIVHPFRTFTLNLDLTAGDESVAAGVLELTAPSMVSAAQALKAMTKPQVLNELAISFSPETDDDDGYGPSNDVLVVS